MRQPREEIETELCAIKKNTHSYGGEGKGNRERQGEAIHARMIDPNSRNLPTRVVCSKATSSFLKYTTFSVAIHAHENKIKIIQNKRT